MMKQHIYPFSAIIGQERMKTALLLNAVDPGIGGVLIAGDKGTGKSTAVRALARILPEIKAVRDCPYHCSPDDPASLCKTCLERISKGENLETDEYTMPVVELPLSATEDRVVGTLHVEHTLKTGERRFEPGLLAAANRGILYVDEVNLLDDHLVDILLDSAASGINIVEREGISHSHPAKFILVGTMNPEEGDLRPQLLDRFGLSLTVRGLEDVGLRRQVVQNRISFDRDPKLFSEKFSGSEKVLSGLILQSKGSFDGIQVPDEMLDLAVRLSMEVAAHGHRADVAMIKTAKALASMLEKQVVEKEHIIEAARFVLPHRMTDLHLATPEMLREKLEEVLSKVMDGKTAETPSFATEDSDDWDDISMQTPGATAASNVDMLFSFFEEKKKLFLKPMS
ncbi:ATP-binding protein [Desulfospira joergensenii]|uniref:ATP-binding protein n=1 Tax=Desulfospira joergensenii TaxID=53329 RepID=UPI000404D04C|nr:ATP-binding protein [Desulfospira joergensenii]